METTLMGDGQYRLRLSRLPRLLPVANGSYTAVQSIPIEYGNRLV